MSEPLPNSLPAASPHSGAIWHENLRALAIRQPDVAARLRAASAPENARIVAGRDGSPVVLLDSSADELHWMGGSSMPSVSVPAALASFADRGVNVGIVGVGTGYEPVALAERMGRHLALFVCTHDCRDLGLALSVADWSAALAAGRIVVLAGDVARELSAFITQFPGYIIPRQLFSLPGTDPAEVTACSEALERAGHQADATYAAALRDVAKAFSHRSVETVSEWPRLLIASNDFRAAAVDVAAELQRAARALGWAADCSVADLPDRSSVLARLHAIRDFQPDLLISINGPLGPMPLQLPAGLKQVCWMLDDAPMSAAVERIAATDRVYASSSVVRDLCVARGVGSNSIELLPLGIDDVAFQSHLGGPPSVHHCDVIVLADVVDTAPSAAGVGLDTHQKLWGEVAHSLLNRAKHGGELSADAALADAERRTGITLRAVEGRASFAALAQARLVTSTAVQAVGETLANLKMEHWGAGVPTSLPHAGEWPIGAEKRAAIYVRAPWIVLPVADAQTLRHALEGILCGAAVVVRRPGRDLLAKAGALREVYEKIPTFAHAAELPGLLKKLSVVKARCAALAEIVRAQHTWRHRLLAIRDTVATG